MSDQKVFTTEDGSHSLHSNTFGVTYHSTHGAIQETQHVFIEAGLREKAANQKHISILDIGFGTGLNAFLTLKESIQLELQIKLSTYEAYPISLEMAHQLNYCELTDPALADYFIQMHACDWETIHKICPTFSFVKFKKSIAQIESANEFDLIYFDAFAPDAQPEMWTDELLAKMYTALKPEGILTTYCAKGSVKRSLKALGFEVIGLPGPPGKREMTKAVKKDKVGNQNATSEK